MPNIIKFVSKLAVGLILFVGLALLGWGLGDLSGFFSHPARLIYVISIFVSQTLLVAIYPDLGQGGGEGESPVPRQRTAVLLLQILSIGVVVAAPFSDRRDLMTFAESNFIRFLGLSFFLLGFGLMNWAEISLGRQFSVQVTLQKEHELITGGIYRYLRHPRYLGIIVFNFGFSLIFRSWFALIVSIGLLGVLIWRIQDEEALMHLEFGEEWEQYAQRSWRLIPFIY